MVREIVRDPIFLAQRGHAVTLAGRNPLLAPDANPRARPELLEKLRSCVRTCPGTAALAVTEEGLLCRDGEGREFTLEADTVICASGLRPRADARDALRSCAPITEIIGDCARPGSIRDAVFRGHYAALDLG